jgi:hypothetical protein
MKNILAIAIWTAIAGSVIGGLWYLYDSVGKVTNEKYAPVAQNAGGAPIGLVTKVSTTSPATVNTTASLVFASSTCNSRIITTYASPIMIGLTDLIGFVPSGVSGHLQLASTTVAYDSGIYGCSAWRVYSFTSQAITVSETI